MSLAQSCVNLRQQYAYFSASSWEGIRHSGWKFSMLDYAWCFYQHNACRNQCCLLVSAIIFPSDLNDLSTDQFHSFVWKVFQFSSGDRAQVLRCPHSVHSVWFIQFSSVTNSSSSDSDWPGWLSLPQAGISPLSLQMFGRSILGPLQWKSQPAGPGFVTWVER